MKRFKKLVRKEEIPHSVYPVYAQIRLDRVKVG